MLSCCAADKNSSITYKIGGTKHAQPQRHNKSRAFLIFQIPKQYFHLTPEASIFSSSWFSMSSPSSNKLSLSLPQGVVEPGLSKMLHGRSFWMPAEKVLLAAGWVLGLGRGKWLRGEVGSEGGTVEMKEKTKHTRKWVSEARAGRRLHSVFRQLHTLRPRQLPNQLQSPRAHLSVKVGPAL